MAGILEYSTTPASNTTINGIGISGGSSVKYGDDAIRQFMADVRSAVTKSSDKAAGTHMATKADHNQLWRVTGNATINLTAAATLTAGWALWVMADGGTATIDPAGSEQINGAGTLALAPGNAALIICTATAFRAVIFNGPVIVGTTPGTVADGVAALQYKGAIGASEDLDTYTTPGIYVQNNNAGASGGTNYPASYAGMLEVLDGGGATNVQTVQRYTSHQDRNLYTRMRRNTGVWTEWEEFVTQSNLPPSTPPSNKTIYLSSATWTKPEGLTKVVVTCLGAGGGSGYTYNASTLRGGGGGGGSFAMAEIDAADLASTEAILVGAGGTAGTSQTVHGGAGGTSSFGAHCSAGGGQGGKSATSSGTALGGAGGVATIGLVRAAGFPGLDNAPLGAGGGGSALFRFSEESTVRDGTGAPIRVSGAGEGIAAQPGYVIVEEYF